jgi:hypothetical protein
MILLAVCKAPFESVSKISISNIILPNESVKSFYPDPGTVIVNDFYYIHTSILIFLAVTKSHINSNIFIIFYLY